MFSRLRAHLPLWRRALRRRRRLLAVLALAALTASLLPSLLPPSSRGVEIVVADAELTPGTALSRADLRTARIAPELLPEGAAQQIEDVVGQDRKSTRLNSSHVSISYAVFCLKKKKTKTVH